MKKRFFPACLMIAGFLMILSSCSKTITCSDGTVILTTVGFSRSDFDSAVVTRYTQDNAFDIAVDSTRVVSFIDGGLDTAKVNAYGSDNKVFMKAGYDYKIVIPAAGKTYLLTKIVLAGNTHQSISTGLTNDELAYSCFNNIVSCNVNGAPLSAASTNGSLAVVITK